jgi:uncharacterized protein YdeI (YjbR/CyaY-like superfamily)
MKDMVMDAQNNSGEVTTVEDVFFTVLKRHGLEHFFLSLSFSHRREYLQWIAGAKQIATRDRRVSKAIEMLREKAERS